MSLIEMLYFVIILVLVVYWFLKIVDSLEVDEKHHPIWNITENIEDVLEGREMNIPSPNIPSFISNTIKPIGKNYILKIRAE